MKTKFTKGDWFTKDGQIYPESTGETLAVIPYFDEDNEEKAANAKLMASSPKMFDALSKAVEKLAPHFFKMGTKKAFSELLVIEEMKNAIREATE